ncbi:hypothetical protein HID58_031393 [Brassica napus]|uniref:Uncharacterized protein n=1 Tax=Brassica napus TaxID=3708 RepID=A0ABQ8BTC3_BRANA|nr:hypothetical protein HID58_031393 [Brassica napus]
MRKRRRSWWKTMSTRHRSRDSKMVEADRHDGEVRRPPNDGSGGQNTEMKTPKTEQSRTR